MQARQPAQYLLRIDDLCETMHRDRWLRLQEMLREFGVRPILALVPENRDPELAVSPPDAQFWDTMRAMESAGAAIALHGFRHVCVRRGGGLLPLSRSGEFAGVPLAVQQEWIRRGLAILRGKGLTPKLWVAPRHNFDASTLRALRGEGIFYLSDGLMREPTARGGMMWIPQQLWSPVEKSTGLWTICVHPNTLEQRGIHRLREFLMTHAAQFTSFERIRHEWNPRPPTMAEIFRQRLELEGMRLRRSIRYAGSRMRTGEVLAEAAAVVRREPPNDPGS